MLEELEVQQKKCYPAGRVWAVSPEDFCSRKAELVIVNLAAEYLGVEKVADWVRESGAEHASVIIYGMVRMDFTRVF